MSDSDRFVVKDNFLLAGATPILVGSPSWYEWLSSGKNFSFKSQGGCFVAQCERRRNKAYWYAYRRAGKLMKVYLGKTEELTLERLEQASVSLTGQSLLKQFADKPAGEANFTTEARIDASYIPLTKFNVPVLPRQLITRPRLICQINTSLILIHAPSGFGKSTLLNDWKQTCGHPVAWLSLDDSDNHIKRFWTSVIMALQTINPEFGKELFNYLRTVSHIHLSEIVSRLTNDITELQKTCSHFGLVLDDFHSINRTEIYDSIQAWLEQLPTNIQLVIMGHTKPPFSLGHLRAKGLLTELETNDLRFTLEEGINYLRQYQQETPLAYDDLAKLVKRTEGWAAGLTLTALALGKQENPRLFVDTFNGAHIYMREYFMETVLQRSSPEVQAFLLKTAILKHLTGSLCDAITGQTGSEEMLSHLWHENLFIVRLEERGWYRYHDLFAEMLLSELEARFPNEVPQLHQRAAEWYRKQYAPADAIYHLLAIQAWEEAALLLEEMALRELEQYGEDSRLLRCLQELPESVVQKHKTLLLVYLRLADMALPKQKIERFITHIETSLSSKPDFKQTQDEREVLAEIKHIRRTWEESDQFTPPTQDGTENDVRWELLNGLRLLRQVDSSSPESWENEVASLLHKAQAQGNLFVILMAGGGLARRALVNGQLRRGEKIARQVLEYALAQRGKLPGPASIALAALSQIHLERNELEPAQKYLAQALEVDLNPTSTNILVQIAIQRAKIQMVHGNFAEALANIQSIRALHLGRPSGLWTDQDLLVYEALIYVRKGDILTAEKLLNESENIGEHSLSQSVRAEILLVKKQANAAEQQLRTIMSQYPNEIPFEPLMPTRVLLAQALFDQHKFNQALQVMREAIRLAAPERFFRPFLEGGAACISLLSLALQTENLTSEAQAFIRELLRLSNYTGGDPQISQAEIEALSTSASISPREQEVLRLISVGYSNCELAQKLSISEATVKTHLSNIYKKLNVNSRVQAVACAKELRVVP
jgi:LuxR family maltose regulon positive regulatory protein